MKIQKVDIILDLALRVLLFVYSLTILSLTLFQLKRDREFLIVICGFTLICTGIYLYEYMYRLITGKTIEKLYEVIYGTSNENEEDFPQIRKVVNIIFFLLILLLSMYLFGIFVAVFVSMVLFPFIYDRQNILISTLVAVITAGLLYYIFVFMIGVSLTHGVIIGF